VSPAVDLAGNATLAAAALILLAAAAVRVRRAPESVSATTPGDAILTARAPHR
jgi:hypothetical protein